MTDEPRTIGRKVRKIESAIVARREEIVAQRASGMTLVEIGKAHKVTRERVRQILAKAGVSGQLPPSPGKVEELAWIEHYRRQGMTYSGIEKLLGLVERSACNRLLNSGIRISRPLLPSDAYDLIVRHIEIVAGCWIWKMQTKANLPVVSLRDTKRSARLVAWEHGHGKVARTHCVRNTCGDKRCINPGHSKLERMGGWTTGMPNNLPLEEMRQRIVDGMRRRHHRRIELGLCSRCGHGAPMKDRKMCKRCSKYISRKRKERRGECATISATQ